MIKLTQRLKLGNLCNIFSTGTQQILVLVSSLPTFLNYFSNSFSGFCTSYSLILLSYKFQFLAFFSLILSLDISQILTALSITSVIDLIPPVYILLSSFLLAIHYTPSCSYPTVTSQLVCSNRLTSFFLNLPFSHISYFLLITLSSPKCPG